MSAVVEPTPTTTTAPRRYASIAQRPSGVFHVHHGVHNDPDLPPLRKRNITPAGEHNAELVAIAQRGPAASMSRWPEVPVFARPSSLLTDFLVPAPAPAAAIAVPEAAPAPVTSAAAPVEATPTPVVIDMPVIQAAPSGDAPAPVSQPAEAVEKPAPILPGLDPDDSLNKLHFLNSNDAINLSTTSTDVPTESAPSTMAPDIEFSADEPPPPRLPPSRMAMMMLEGLGSTAPAPAPAPTPARAAPSSVVASTPYAPSAQLSGIRTGRSPQESPITNTDSPIVRGVSSPAREDVSLVSPLVPTAPAHVTASPAAASPNPRELRSPFGGMTATFHHSPDMRVDLEVTVAARSPGSPPSYGLATNKRREPQVSYSALSKRAAEATSRAMASTLASDSATRVSSSPVTA